MTGGEISQQTEEIQPKRQQNTKTQAKTQENNTPLKTNMDPQNDGECSILVFLPQGCYGERTHDRASMVGKR